MKSAQDLGRELQRIAGRGYKAYRSIQGVYDFARYVLLIDYVQGDPFASPSRIRVRIPQHVAQFPDNTFNTKSREVALRDYVTRAFYSASKKFCRGRRGTGKSGIISIDRPGQEVLERTSAFITPDYVEIRFVMGLPAFGRRIAGTHCHAMFFEELPRIVESVQFGALDRERLYEHLSTVEDADFLRDTLSCMGLVGFVADGSVLPRVSGVDPRPLTEKVVPFRSPDSLRREVDLPNKGIITGMGVPEGVTLVVGGGYHGKSTLLNAIELGVYDHIPGDGREFVVSNFDTVKIRAEDGRRIEKVDISPFIGDLPFGQSTKCFSTENASGSTSQAANIMEALEVGAEVLIIDEDTSATNFMIRDHRMQELVSKDKEPITPFIDKVGQLHEDYGVSTVLVIGGSGDYFDVADTVICMVEYVPQDVTDKAHEIAERFEAERISEGGQRFGDITERIPVKESFDASKGKRQVKISARGIDTILFGIHEIDLQDVEQLVDVSQTRAIGDAIYYATRYMDGERTLRDTVDVVCEDVRKNLDILSPVAVGNYAAFRRFELVAAINRLRTLRTAQSRCNERKS
ncbi:MAG: ABC-ATPase domain-containing protein [Theionarchaea archaeon]|nr:ABC-ATPase domain-containing protein [Theionarchaea archaeon]MBU7037870.1 ABC-ATPase domain-containing protein [Theionarchaea archaeon]